MSWPQQQFVITQVPTWPGQQVLSPVSGMMPNVQYQLVPQVQTLEGQQLQVTGAGPPNLIQGAIPIQSSGNGVMQNQSQHLFQGGTPIQTMQAMTVSPAGGQVFAAPTLNQDGLQNLQMMPNTGLVLLQTVGPNGQVSLSLAPMQSLPQAGPAQGAAAAPGPQAIHLNTPSSSGPQPEGPVTMATPADRKLVRKKGKEELRWEEMRKKRRGDDNMQHGTLGPFLPRLIPKPKDQASIVCVLPALLPDQQDPQPTHVKEELDAPEPPQIKVELEAPELPYIKVELKDPDLPYIKVELVDPELPQIKVQQEELWTSQEEREQLQMETEADGEDCTSVHPVELWISQEIEQLQDPAPLHIEEEQVTKLPSTTVPMRSEDDEENPQSSQLHQSQAEENREAEPLASSSTQQIETEADGEDCGVSEPARNVDPGEDLQPANGDYDESVEDDDATPPSRVELRINKILAKKRYSWENAFSWDTPFVCPVCSKRFRTKQCWQPHVLSCKLILCPVCGGSFPTKSDIAPHMRQKHAEDDKPFLCSACLIFFPSKEDLKSHQKQLHPEKFKKPLFLCSVCGKCCTTHYEFKTHTGKCSGTQEESDWPMNVHRGERVGRKEVCSVCDKLYDANYLKVHMAGHMAASEKTLKCSVCGKGFDFKNQLAKHMVVHTDKEALQCSVPVCLKTFASAEQLKRHMRVHTGE